MGMALYNITLAGQKTKKYVLNINLYRHHCVCIDSELPVTTEEVKDGQSSPKEASRMQTTAVCLWGYLAECGLA